ncbi:aspartic protease [Tricladium varicosporioides]|nr:aspartic protease [Hymenoscyphus varicosporioides]
MAPSFTSVAQAACLLLVPFVSAAPIVEAENAKQGSFAITQVKNPSFVSVDGLGPAAHLHAFLKYNVAPPKALLALNGSAINGEVPATPFPTSFDREYLSPVSIGNPPQTLDLDFDTGSSDLWVFSSETAKELVNGQKLYTPAKSVTSQALKDHTWSISYGDGSSCSGTVVHERVTLGSLTYESQAVEVANIVSSSFTQDTASSGLLGLAFSSINQVKPTAQKTWVDNMAGSLAAPVFTVDLKKGAVGSYNFGSIDSSKYTGNISYVPVNNKKGFWQVMGSGYQVGKKAFVSTQIDTIADTGTTLLLLPLAVVKAYYAEVKGATYSADYGAYVFPCTATLPDFTFGMDKYRGTIPGSFIKYGTITTSTCYGGIQDKGNMPFSIFGDILLKAQFVVFDVGNNRLGFASKKL